MKGRPPQDDFISSTPNGTVLLRIRVQPRSSTETLAGYHQDSLKIRITSAPVEGEANAACIKFLASLFRRPKSSLAIKTGHKSRSKIIEITGLSPDEVKRIINREMQGTAQKNATEK
ncbi:MAG: DUF167 domain-containing protein [Pseudomonadota bacterium]